MKNKFGPSAEQVATPTNSNSHSTFLSWFISTVLVAFVWFVVDANKREQKRAEIQQKLNEGVHRVREAVRQGKAGKAFQKMYPDDHKIFLENQKLKKAQKAEAAKNNQESVP